MYYLADYDSYTEVAETTGTIQNGDTIFDMELRVINLPTSDTATLKLNPGDTQVFVDKKIYIRCLEEGKKIPARVVPIKLYEI